MNQGSICPTSGADMARYTRGSMQEGPGVIIKRAGGRSSPIISFMILFLAAFRSLQLREPASPRFEANNWRLGPPSGTDSLPKMAPSGQPPLWPHSGTTAFTGGHPPIPIHDV